VQDDTRREKQKPNSDATATKITDPGNYPEGSIPNFHLHVTKAGGKIWRYKYRLHGKPGLFTIGKFPGISHARACELARQACTSVAEGVAPLKAKKARIEAEIERDGTTFERIAEQWLSTRASLAKKTLLNYRTTIDLHVLPALGKKPVHEVTWRDISQLLVSLGSRPTAAAHARVTIKQILDFAVDLGAIEDNVSLGRGKVRGKALVEARKTRHHPALLTVDDLREYFGRLMDMAPPDKPATWALWLLPMLAVRPSELCAMRWEDLDLEMGLWSFTPPKTGRPLIVPLAPQVVAQLRLIQDRRGMIVGVPRPFGLGGRVDGLPAVSGWVFASGRLAAKHICPTTLLLAIRALGYSENELTAHGFRTTFRTLGHEELNLDPIALELSLGHRMPGPLGETYVRTQLLPQRKVVMQKWTDFLERLCVEATAVYGSMDPGVRALIEHRTGRRMDWPESEGEKGE